MQLAEIAISKAGRRLKAAKKVERKKIVSGQYLKQYLMLLDSKDALWFDLKIVALGT
jgi:hypothetical protein